VSGTGGMARLGTAGMGTAGDGLEPRRRRRWGNGGQGAETAEPPETRFEIMEVLGVKNMYQNFIGTRSSFSLHRQNQDCITKAGGFGGARLVQVKAGPAVREQGEVIDQDFKVGGGLRKNVQGHDPG